MKKKFSIKRVFLLITATIIIAACFGFLGLYSLNKTLALDNEILSSINTQILIYDNENNDISSNYSPSSPFIKLEKLNQYTIDAFTSIEDDKFLSHNGLNYTRMIKALINNIKAGKIVEGASTISQQLIKNTHLNSDKTISRKIKEVLLTRKLEKTYTKNEIMELYLNAIYFGSGCYGIESASLFYFGISADKLTINQSAILAGLIKSPTYYSPIYYEENCFNRKNLVLKQMLKHGKIKQDEYDTLIKQKIETNISKVSHQDFTYLNCAVVEASKKLNIDVSMLQKEGYKIYTYYDKRCQDSLKSTLANKDAHFNSMIVENESGKIKGFFSSIKYGASSLKRSPASALKPILVYAPAIEKGDIYPCFLINDEKTDFNGYSPNNLNNKYYGNVPVKKALSLSLNVPAVKILKDAGIEYSKSVAEKCGITFDDEDNSLALALGGMNYGTSISELCTAYTTLFDGNKKDCTFIKKIEDKNGNIVYKHSIKKSKTIKESTAFLVGEMMEDCATNGTCKALSTLPYSVRAKSGTSKLTNSENNNSALCVGQTSLDTVCVWFFSIDNQVQNSLSPQKTLELSPSVRVKEIFEKIYTTYPKDFEKPDSVVTKKIDSISYKEGRVELASENTPERYTLNENFDKDNVVKKVSTNFLTASKVKLKAKENENKITLSFNALPHEKYTIIKKDENDNETILCTIKNKNGEFTYNDDKVEKGKTYTYYCKAEIEISQATNIATSKEVVVSYKKEKSPLSWFN